MQLIPASLVPVARGYLQQQGYDPSIFNLDGSLNELGAVSLFYDTVTISTAVTPDLVFPISPSGAPPSPAMQQLLNQLQPTVKLTGRAGTVLVAPYGAPQGQRSWLPLALIGGGAVLFVGWAFFGR